MRTFSEYLTRRDRVELEKEKLRHGAGELGYYNIIRGDDPDDYIGIGHGEEDLVQLWIYNPRNGEFKATKPIGASETDHHTAFSEIPVRVHLSCPFGRYDVRTKDISISLPIGMEVDEVLPILKSKFDIARYHIF